jgi:hypothetical protein
MKLNSRTIVFGAVAFGGIAGAFFLYYYLNSPSRFTSRTALKELEHPRNDDRARHALWALQKQGVSTLPQLLQFYKDANTAEQRAYAVGLLLTLPATSETVQAMVELVDREQNPASRERFAHYLEQATDQKFGSDGPAWQEWWQKDGKNQKTFHVPYGTMPVTDAPQR